MFKVLVKITFSGGLIWWLVSQSNPERLVKNMMAVDPWGFLLAVVILGSLSMAQAWRWSLVVRAIGKFIRYGDALQNVLIGIFFNQLLPSSIGGDAVRVWRTYRLGLGVVPAAHSVMLDRLLALLALALMAVVGMPVIFDLFGDRPERWAGLIFVCGVLTAFGMLLMFDRIPEKVKKWRLLGAIANLSADSRHVFLNFSTALPAVMISVCIHVSVALTVYIIGQAMALPVSALDCIILVPLVMLFSMLPVSVAGWGLREGAMVTVFAFVDIGYDEAFALSVLFGLAIMLSAVPGGVLWVICGGKQSEGVAGVETVSEILQEEETAQQDGPV